MHEQSGEFTNPEAVLSAVWYQARNTETLPRIQVHYRPGYSEDMRADIERFAHEAGQTPEEYAEKLVLQRLESEVFVQFMTATGTPAEYGIVIDALGTWIDGVLPTPRDSVKVGRIENQGLARSLIFNGSSLLEDANGRDADLIFDKIVPFFDVGSHHSARKRLATAMHTVAGCYAGRDGLAKLGQPGHARAAINIFSEATEAGLLPGDFWYSRGVRSAHGQLQFSVVEGVYDQLVIKGRDIRPRYVDARQLWEHIPNYCIEILDAVTRDESRHATNTLLVLQHLEKHRAAGSKDLPPMAFVKMANVLTERINDTPNGFGEDLDGLPAGRREPLPEGDIYSLGDAMRRLLYVTRRADRGEEVAEWQQYQDDIYTGSVEGLVGLLTAPGRAKKVGGVAVRQASAQEAYDAAREAAIRPRKFDWVRRKPGRGYLS